MGEVIVAEHARAAGPGAEVVDPIHIAEMWKLTMKRQASPPRAQEKFLFQMVEATPLTIYEGMVG